MRVIRGAPPRSFRTGREREGTLRDKGVGAQIHYIPIYRHPYYQRQKYHEALPGAEYFYEHTLTIPLHTKITRVEQSMVATIIAAALDKYEHK